MNPELVYGLYCGLGIAFIFAVLHTLLLRALARPLLEQKSFAPMALRILTGALFLDAAIAIAMAQMHFAALDYPSAALLPATVLGLALYHGIRFALTAPRFSGRSLFSTWEIRLHWLYRQMLYTSAPQQKPLRIIARLLLQKM